MPGSAVDVHAHIAPLDVADEMRAVCAEVIPAESAASVCGRWTMRRTRPAVLRAAASVVAAALLFAGCGSSSDPEPASADPPATSAPAASEADLAATGAADDLSWLMNPDLNAVIATVDGVEVLQRQLAELHVDLAALSAQELASSVYLLVLHEALVTRAQSELGVTADEAAVGEAFAQRTVRYSTEAELASALAATNVASPRLRIEAELDAVRDAIAATLVYEEAPGFDIDAAYRAYLIDNAEVCVRQMLFESVDDFNTALARLDASEDFAQVARDLSVDPFVDRDEGLVGAGGDLGCSAPAALPVGLDAASLDAVLDDPYGPVGANTGLHLLVVYDRTTPALDDVRDEVLDHAVALQGPELFRRWAVSVLESVDVDVDGAYGAWGALPETGGLPTVVPVDQVDRMVGP